MKIFALCLYCGIPTTELEDGESRVDNGYDCQNCGFSIRVNKECANTIYWNPENTPKSPDDGVVSDLPGWWTDVPEGCLLVVNGEKM